MNKFTSRLRQPALIVLSFAAGYGFYHYSVTIWDPVYQGWELTNSRVETLRQEVIPFFYRTMRELFEGTYDPNDGYVKSVAVGQFSQYKSRLEPRCRLINVYFYDAAFASEVLFPSGDRFAVAMIKGEKEWRLDSFGHIGSDPTYRDLRSGDKQDGKP
jgi:hypothetical protein